MKNIFKLSDDFHLRYNTYQMNWFNKEIELLSEDEFASWLLKNKTKYLSPLYYANPKVYSSIDKLDNYRIKKKKNYSELYINTL